MYVGIRRRIYLYFKKNLYFTSLKIFYTTVHICVIRSEMVQRKMFPKYKYQYLSGRSASLK